MYGTKEEILTSGLAISKVRVLLEVVCELDAKAIDAAIDAAGIKAKRSNGFASDYYDYLSEETRTKDEALAFILGTGSNEGTSKNVRAHESHYLNIWELVATIRDGYESEEEEG